MSEAISQFLTNQRKEAQFLNLVDQMGWNEASRLVIALDFIRSIQQFEAFFNYAFDRAEEENGA